MPDTSRVSSAVTFFFSSLVLLLSLSLFGYSEFGVKLACGEEKTAELPDFDKLWDYQKPDVTEQKFRELLPPAEKAGNKSYQLQLLTQIARTQGLQMKFKEAHQTLDKVDKLMTDEYPVVKIRYLLERGRVYNSSQESDLAKPLFIQAWELSLQEKADFYAVDAAHMLGIIEPPVEALKWNEKAMKHAEASSDKKAELWLGALYNNIGWTYFDRKEYDKALDLFKKDIYWYQEHKRPVEARIARWSMAKTLRHLGKTQQALDIQRNILQEIKVSKAEPDGYVFEELGECLHALDKKEEAQTYFAQAYELLQNDQWLVRDEPERLERLKKLGNVAAADPAPK